MTITRRIKVPIYACAVSFIITDNLRGDVLKLWKRFKCTEEYKEDDHSEGMLWYSTIDQYYLFIDPQYLSHNTIAHENTHLAFKMLSDRDIKDEEATCWLVGHLAAELYKFLDKKKIPIKHV